MGEQKRKSNWWKWAAGAAAFGAAVFLGVKAFGGSNNTQTAGVSVTPTVLIAEASSTPEQMVTVTIDINEDQIQISGTVTDPHSNGYTGTYRSGYSNAGADRRTKSDTDRGTHLDTNRRSEAN